MSKILSINEILSASDLEEKAIEVSEWGGTVKVRGMTKQEQQQLRKQATDAAGQINPDLMEQLMIAHCLAEPRITVEQAGQLMQKSASAVDKVLTAIMDVAGLSEAAQKAMVRSFHAGDEGPKKTS